MDIKSVVTHAKCDDYNLTRYTRGHNNTQIHFCVCVQKKKGDKGAPTKHLSAPSLGAGAIGGQQRLEPLPNSPLHDSALNPTKPLPQPGGFSKKFVK